MGDYYYNDIVSAIKYGKTNPNGSIEDWLTKRSKSITAKEIKLYENIKFAKTTVTIKGIPYELIVLKGLHADTMKRFIDKMVGVKPYYELDPMPGEWNAPIHIVLALDNNIFNLNDWLIFKNFKNAKYIEDDSQSIMLTYPIRDDNEWDEMDYDRWDKKESSLRRDMIGLWDYHTEMKGYIKYDAEFDFQPVEGLFKTTRTRSKT